MRRKIQYACKTSADFLYKFEYIEIKPAFIESYKNNDWPEIKSNQSQLLNFFFQTDLSHMTSGCSILTDTLH